jgi:hypothetical protein
MSIDAINSAENKTVQNFQLNIFRPPVITVGLVKDTGVSAVDGITTEVAFTGTIQRLKAGQRQYGSVNDKKQVK